MAGQLICLWLLTYIFILTAPLKLSRRHKCSESSISTDSGVTNSKHRSQEDLLPVEEDLPAFIVTGGTVISEGFRRPKIDIQVQTIDNRVNTDYFPLYALSLS